MVAEGAGLIALEEVSAFARSTLVDGCGMASGRGRPVADAIAEAVSVARLVEPVDLVVIAPWGPPAADALRGWASVTFPGARVVSTAALGESLAASAALAVIAAADLLEQRGGRAVVLTLGVDGDPGVVVLSREAA